jgi:hypothetical protein
MPRSGCQLRVRDPNLLLLLPLLARPHRHAPILRTKSVDTSKVFAYESELAPRAANHRYSPTSKTNHQERKIGRCGDQLLWFQ